MGKQRKKPTFRPYRVGEYRLGWLLDQFVAVFYEDSQRRRHRLGVATEEEARTELHAFARTHLKLADEPTETLKALFRQYVADRKQEGQAEERLNARWPSLGPVFGHMRPVDITKKHCRDYATARAVLGRKPHAIHSELAQLRTIINWAAQNKLIPLADVPTIWVPPMPEARDRHLTRQEVNLLLDAAELPHIRLFLILALTTAARKGALLGLTWSRVDFERGLIHLRDPEKERTAKRAAPSFR